MSPVDPRLAGSPLGIQDPLLAALAAMRLEMASMQRQIDDLRAAPTIQVLSGAPNTTPRDGTPALDITNRRLYVMATTWGYTPLT